MSLAGVVDVVLAVIHCKMRRIISNAIHTPVFVVLTVWPTLRRVATLIQLLEASSHAVLAWGAIGVLPMYVRALHTRSV